MSSPTEVSPEVVIDCSGNPLDLRPAADRLETIIRQRVAKNPGQPLVVMMGEDHTMPAHVTLQQLLMQRLSDPHNNPLRIACGVEWPHNMVDEILAEPKFDRGPLPAQVRSHIAAGSTPDKQFQRAYHSVLAQHRAPLTHRNLMTWADRHDISVRPVDAAWKPDLATLDNSDKLTNEIIEKTYPDLGKPIKFDESDENMNARYMRVRNLVACDRVQGHIADTHAQIYFLPYGGTHLLGSTANPGKTMKHPYEDSFHSLFGNAGMQTLPVFAIEPDYLPPGAESAFGHSVVVRGLNSESFKNESSSKRENDFLHEINARSGGHALKLYADHGLKAWFGYGPNHQPHTTQLLVPSSRPTSRRKIIGQAHSAAQTGEKKPTAGRHRKKPHPVRHGPSRG